jgi:hypothetical protein
MKFQEKEKKVKLYGFLVCFIFFFGTILLAEQKTGGAG